LWRKKFNYTDNVKVWHTDKCYYKVLISNEWKISESEEVIIKGKDFTEKNKCGPCRNFCSSRYKLSFHKEKLQLCHWEEVPLVVNLNGEVIFVIEITVIFNLILQILFGIWKNSSFSCLNTDKNYLYSTYFNYSSQPLNDNYIMPTDNPINSLQVSFNA
jgi:hypothetical protein